MTLQERFATLNATTSENAQAWARQGGRATLWHLLFLPLQTFFSAYISKGEWKHGVAGLTTALFDSYAVFVSYTKLWEIQNGLTVEPPTPRGETGSAPANDSHSDAA